MFLYRSENEETYEKDRRRVMEEIFRAVLADRHREICEIYGLPEGDAGKTPPPVPLSAPRPLALPAPEKSRMPERTRPHEWNGPLRGR